MAANNYFGFTHGGTQYSSPAATYQTGQAGYAVAQPYSQQARTPQAGYEGYQAPQAGYGFGARQQQQQQQQDPTVPSPTIQAYYSSSNYQRSTTTTTTTTYDGTKTYYQQQPQANKTPYTANANTFPNANRPNAAQKNSTNNSSYGYAASVATTYPTNYASNNAATPATTTATYSGYDAALYSAATMYVQQQQQQQTTNVNANKQPNNWSAFKKPGMKMNRPKQPPKPQQLHYCDVCKISCAGPQTYREHLEGQKHKKKEAAAKAGTVTQTARPGNSLRCELCDVTCTGADAYAAHIRGAKHQKVVKLHTKLGKPIPSTEPTVVGAAGDSPAAAPVAKKIVTATPKISFVGGTSLSTTASTNPATEVAAAAMPVTPAMPIVTAAAAAEELREELAMDISKYDDKSDIQPVGQDYIEEIKNDEGKVISFQCKLCECRFNDPNAKEMHMKGRRHRLQYKKKVNPDLVVDIKPSLRQRKIQEEKMRRQQLKEEFWRRRDEERWREEMRTMEEEERLYWEERRRYEEEMEYYEWYRRFGRDPRGMPPPQMMRPFPGQPGPNGPPMPPRRPDTLEDRHVLSKHSQIYPKEEELQAVQKIVSNTEKALKQVSDHLAESVVQADAPPEVKTEATEAKPAEKEEPNSGPVRILKGVMRVGVLAKGLLLRGDVDVQLVVLCSEKPTRTLLMKVCETLPEQLSKVTEEKYEVVYVQELSVIRVMTMTEPRITVTVTLTSPVIREASAAEEGGDNVTSKDPPDVLDRQKCLDALAALRHAKWFQARASGLQSCVIIIRILRDLCQRVPTWTPLNSWAMELLVEKALCSSGVPMSPGDALRRVLEAIASGILLSGGPGLLDPCEKDPTDSATSLTNQEREDITASAQHALRLIAFRQIHKVLGMDPLPVPKFPKGRYTRKRRRDNSTGEGGENEGADGKKDKKDDAEIKMDSEAVVVVVAAETPAP